MKTIVTEVFSYAIGKFRRPPRGHITFELVGLDFMVDELMQASKAGKFGQVTFAKALFAMAPFP